MAMFALIIVLIAIGLFVKLIINVRKNNGNWKIPIGGLVACLLLMALLVVIEQQTPPIVSQTPTPEASPLKENALDSLIVQPYWTQDIDSYGYSKINGSVKNVGNRPIRYFKVTAEYLGVNGQVLDTAYTNSDERINPGNEKRFEIMHKHSPDFKHANVFVDKVVFE